MKRIEELEAKTGLNSQNSSRPPSQDPPDAPPRPRKAATGRSRGGQPGHAGTRRELLPVEDVEKLIVDSPTKCQECGASLPEKPGAGDPAPVRHQVYELAEKPYTVTEYQAHSRTCGRCGAITRGKIPEQVVGSSFGPRMAAMVSMLTGVLQASRRCAEEFVRDALDVPIALGTVSNLEGEMTEALGESYKEAGQVVQESGAKNVDETGWKRKGKRCWLWTAATAMVAFFVIHDSRGKEGFLSLLGRKIQGIFTTDRWGVYGAIKSRFRQVCWAHLLRDFQRLVDMGGQAVSIGETSLRIGKEVFELWKAFRTGVFSRGTLKRRLRPLKKELHQVLKRGAGSHIGKASTFCENLLALEDALWTFAYEEGVEPTNNHAERVLRRGVLWRKRSFGAQSDRGCRFVERMLTTVQTLRLQERPVLAFLATTLKAYRSKTALPSLVTP